ncbi:MAG: lamin tail domain-containing protein [Deltaproteobacteria bacterium]|nr:lamin tail domain-containing protein [Deltaproteobacteria bacterium]
MHARLSRDRSLGRVLSAVSVLFALALTVMGCADRTALRLVIRSNLAVPGELESVLIQMRSSTGASAPPRSVSLTGTAFPQTLVVRPESSGMSGTVTFTVQGLRAGSIVIQRVVSAPFQSGQVVDVEVELNNDCLGIECGPGIDCLRGACVGTPVDAGVMVDAFVGPDGGLDAFGVPVDASSNDVFTPGADAFANDAFVPGADAFSNDAFTPGADAFRAPDAFVPVDAFRAPDAFTPADAFVIPDAFVPADSGIACSGAGCAGIVLISEFTHTGPAGALDEIVEIHNTSTRTADIGGAQMFYTSASGSTRSGRATVPAGTRIPPGGYYLFAGMTYAGSPAADATPWTMGASDTGGSWSLEHGGVVLDRVCWAGAVASICEGTGLTTAPPSAGSYERKANASSTAASMSAGGADERAGNNQDTGNNAMDFVLRTTREPQASVSAAEP